MAKKSSQQLIEGETHRHRLKAEIQGTLVILASIAFLLSLLSFQVGNPAANWLGLLGYGLGYSLRFAFGLASYCLIIFGFWLGWSLLFKDEELSLKRKCLFFLFFLCSFCLLLDMAAEGLPILENWFAQTNLRQLNRFSLGGVPFDFLYRGSSGANLKLLLSPFGTLLASLLTALTSLMLLFDTPLTSLVKKMALSFVQLFSPEKWSRFKKKPLDFTPVLSSEPMFSKRPVAVMPVDEMRPQEVKIFSPMPRPVAIEEKQVVQASKEKIKTRALPRSTIGGYQHPPLTLLSQAKKVDLSSLKKGLKEQAQILEETLMSFGIEAKVGEIYCGPSIISFEVHPAIGVKVQKIKALEDDLALNMQAKSIRIIAPIPGKAAVGVEIPNPQPQEVSFKEMLEAYHEKKVPLHIPLLLGKTVSGEDVVADLSKMPHCIIAGATGSGKSVCINSIIMSIVMNASPAEIRLLMVDPKKVELTAYSSLPHMIAPVITEPREACMALNWLVKEMEKRYEILKVLGTRNIVSFNTRKANKDHEASLGIEIPERMSYYVAIIDELADLMMVSDCDIETPITRIAQMARAVGIHLILATQRPSREVITGLIKANFPTRIAFKVASRVNSQIILDETGAETLLGNGDMLFLPPGTSTLIRAQGAYVRDEDINKVVAFACDQAPPHYLIQSFNDHDDLGDLGQESSDGPKDSLYDQAKSIVLETGSASTTFLQRKLKVGYARAASIMDELESNGVISPQDGSKPRQVLLGRTRLQSPLDEDDDAL